MKILPTIILACIGIVSTTPIMSASSGLLLSKSPKISNTQQQSCPSSQKDVYGRCPYTGQSNFRYLSTGGTSGGRSGSGGGGGK